ncbi:MAG: DNA polymerase III subunit delta' [Actinomycetales bacterium]|nr:DNA polymerase III subunit delta' [Actinomycetales bacterium]
MSAFDVVIGQNQAVAELKFVVDQTGSLNPWQATAMTHAWLITGPPGSGRSTLAMAFAQSLVCPTGGCGNCQNCRSVIAGTHSDVEHVVPEGMNYSIDDATALIERSVLSPTRSPWHVFVVEDVDRFRVDAASVLLKSLEEPPPATVWILCAPTAEDVFDTIRSRCRHLSLVTPNLAEVANELITKNGVNPDLATWAARVAQGHIGRARALGTSEEIRNRRTQIVEIPFRLHSVSMCFSLAARIIEAASADAEALAAPLDLQDEADIRMAFGDGSTGKGLTTSNRQMKSALKDLEKRAKTRHRRMLNDQFDRILLDLTAVYRDVLVMHSGAQVEVINLELTDAIIELASRTTPSSILARIDSINEARDQLVANVSAQLVFEALLVRLLNPAGSL